MKKPYLDIIKWVYDYNRVSWHCPVHRRPQNSPQILLPGHICICRTRMLNWDTRTWTQSYKKAYRGVTSNSRESTGNIQLHVVPVQMQPMKLQEIEGHDKNIGVACSLLGKDILLRRIFLHFSKCGTMHWTEHCFWTCLTCQSFACNTVDTIPGMDTSKIE